MVVTVSVALLSWLVPSDWHCQWGSAQWGVEMVTGAVDVGTDGPAFPAVPAAGGGGVMFTVCAAGALAASQPVAATMVRAMIQDQSKPVTHRMRSSR